MRTYFFFFFFFFFLFRVVFFLDVCFFFFFFLHEGCFLFGSLLSLSSVCTGCYSLDMGCAAMTPASASKEVGAMGSTYRHCLVAEPWAVAVNLREMGVAPRALDNGNGGVCVFPGG